MARGGLWSKLVARLHGEVPADVLDSYRTAGLEVYELLAEVETVRLEAQLKGLTPWTLDRVVQVQSEAAMAWLSDHELGQEGGYPSTPTAAPGPPSTSPGAPSPRPGRASRLHRPSPTRCRQPSCTAVEDSGARW